MERLLLPTTTDLDGAIAAAVSRALSLDATDHQNHNNLQHRQDNEHQELLKELVSSATTLDSVLLKKAADMRDQIYCTGSLLAAVQEARLFVDCKTFVDMPIKSDAESVLLAWNLLRGVENRQIDPVALGNFIDEHFDQPGGELEDYQPADFNAEEQFSAILDPNYRAWAQDLHRKWPTLCRRVSEKVQSAPNRYSLIALPKPFVVPGGRFREMYYWDSFFSIKGLLASGMYTTVRGMIENLGHMIEVYGFIPNGNRVYYLNRSQPPLLTWCLDAYFQATQDTDFLRSAMPWLEREVDFFTTNKCYRRPEWPSPLFRYHVVSEGPRPESYREDVESAEHIEDAFEKKRLWGDIAAAAESGRDFSARWFQNAGPMAGTMGSTRTSSILPVDLNAIICGNLRIVARFYEALGEHERAERAMHQFEAMRETIHRVFWSEEHGCWFDFDLATNSPIASYYDTNFFPLMNGCAHDGFNGKRVVEYLEKAGVLNFPGGMPTSLITSGQQWDFPNAWAPTTWVIVQGLRLCGESELAKTIAEKWIQRNYIIWRESGGRMFEKYNVSAGCFRNASGGGGEYEPQEGFGWTNGVILDLLMTYGSELSWPDEFITQYMSTANCECCRPQARVVNELLSSDLHPVMPPDVMEQPSMMDLGAMNGLHDMHEADMHALHVHHHLNNHNHEHEGEVPNSEANDVVDSLVSSDLFCQMPNSRHASMSERRRPSFSSSAAAEHRRPSISMENAVEALFGTSGPIGEMQRSSRRPSFSVALGDGNMGGGGDSLGMDEFNSTNLFNSPIAEEPFVTSDLKVIPTEEGGLLIEERPSEEAIAAMANVAVQMMANAAAHSMDHHSSVDPNIYMQQLAGQSLVEWAPGGDGSS